MCLVQFAFLITAGPAAVTEREHEPVLALGNCRRIMEGDVALITKKVGDRHKQFKLLPRRDQGLAVNFWSAHLIEGVI